MAVLREFVQRLRFLMFHRRLDRELAEEIREHLTRATEENTAKGMLPVEAHYAALRQFGNVQLQQERSREYWGFPRLESFVQDMRFGVRMMCKSPILTVVAVLTLALGIGANVAIATIARSVFWRSFPYERPDRLAILWSSNQKTGWSEMQVSVPDVEDWASSSRSFQSVSGYTWTDYKVFNVSDWNGAERIRGVAVLPHLLNVLGLYPVLGHEFEPLDFFGDSRVVLISNAIWKQRFGGDRDVIGLTLRLNREPFRIVGVLPPNFELPDLGKAAELLVPLALDSPEVHVRSQRILLPIARLRNGVTHATARAEAQEIAQQLAHDHPAEDGNYSVNPQWVSDDESDKNARENIPVFLFTVALVLLIATANVLIMTIARLATRSHELEMRTALGATRGRVLRQMTTEAVLLSLVAGLVAVFAARWLIQVIMSYKPFYLDNYDVHLGPGGVALVLVLSATLGSILGVLPALNTGGENVQELLGRSVGHASAGRWQSNLRRFLVVTEIGICVALLTSAALMVRTIRGLESIDIGFNPRGLMMARMTLDGSRYKSPASYMDFYNQLIGRLRLQSGLQSVTGASHIDFGGYDMGYEIKAVGEPPPLNLKEFPVSGAQVVMPGYFRDMQSPIVHGREFTEHEAQPAIIINQALAHKLFRDSDPIGKTVLVGSAPQVWDESLQPGPRTIVGVVPDIRRYAEFLKKPFPQFYVPLEQNPVPSMYVLVRSDNPEAAITAIRQTVSSIDRELPIYWAASMKAKIDEWYAAQHFQAVVLTCFAGLALLICLSGLYAVISHSVSRRTAEIGIRLALGAEPRQTVLLMMREGVWLIMSGTVTGIFLAVVLARLLRSFLYQVQPTDLPTFTLAVLSVCTTACLATYVPSRRAARIDPMNALRAP